VGAETRRQVLIIDNNEDVLTTVDRELKEAGYDMVTTWSGVEALRLLNSHTFLIRYSLMTISRIYILATFWRGFLTCQFGRGSW
jgi:CheY-like chemotaxis protein